ncbi:MAG: undecaprenyldiphospho-muramoylpentapeptide beta-N-acetylglucosaminyltransferase [Patescibacteria group bacterium]
MRILFTGGGTGGHIFPIISIKRAFKDAQGFQFYYLGPDSFAKENFAKEEIRTRFILAGKFRRYFSLETPIDLIKIFVSIIQCFWDLFIFMPDIVFSKGGYGSFPVVLVGWIYQIPIILHESDSAPGLANRITAKFAKKIILSFPESKNYFSKYQEKIVLIGNPIREELIQGDETKGKELFKISSEKPVILVIGGSQGAQKINEIILNTLPRLLELAEVIHIAGQRNLEVTLKETQKILKSCENLKQFYHPVGFLNAEELKHAYALADLIINRAGAGSIFEIAALGKPSILIPIPNSAQDHQRKNAYEFAQTGGAIVLEQENLTPNIFLEEISRILGNASKVQEMAQKAKSFYKPNTAERIRDEIINLAKSKS